TSTRWTRSTSEPTASSPARRPGPPSTSTPRTPSSATPTAATRPVSGCSWPADWWRPASGSSPSPTAGGGRPTASPPPPPAAATRSQLPQCAQALPTLITDLANRGLFESTPVMIPSEFGRTPKINGTAGRDHWPKVFSVVLAGGGIKKGFVYGKSDATASE